MKSNVLNEYIEYKKTSVKSLNKIKDIERYIDKFLNSFKQNISKCKEKDLVKFLNSLQKEYRIISINDIKAYIKNFIKWKFEDYPKRFRHLDQLCRTEKPPKTYEPEQMLSLKEVEKLIKGEKDLMWKTFWLVFFYGGFRPSEVIVLKWNNVSFEDKGIIIKSFSKKNKKTFYKSLPNNAEHYIKEWKKYNQSEWLFPSPLREDDHIKSKSVYFRLKNLSKRILNKQVSPYILRHSIATIKYNDDSLKDDDVANQLGHTQNMKELYLNLDEEQLKTRARNIYVKPKALTSKEKDEIKKLKEEMKKQQEQQEEKLKYMEQRINRLQISSDMKVFEKIEKNPEAMTKKYIKMKKFVDNKYRKLKPTKDLTPKRKKEMENYIFSKGNPVLRKIKHKVISISKQKYKNLKALEIENLE